MSDLDNAINSINASAAKAENTATFLDDMSTFDDQSSVTNPNNGQTVASIPKQVKDRTDELFAAAESDINQAVSNAEQSATDAQDAADSIGRYQGLWPDTGGSADKGDTYQTQVSGTPTGQYFTALENTTVDPVGDDVNWREVVTTEYVTSNFTLAFANVDAMLAFGNILEIDQLYSTGGTTWKMVSKSDPVVIGDFKPLNSINVKDFGAVGDGINDDSLAILYAVEIGRSVYIPEGNYRITRAIQLPANCDLIGAGRPATSITIEGGSAGISYGGYNVVKGFQIIMPSGYASAALYVDLNNIQDNTQRGGRYFGGHTSEVSVISDTPSFGGVGVLITNTGDDTGRGIWDYHFDIEYHRCEVAVSVHANNCWVNSNSFSGKAYGCPTIVRMRRTGAWEARANKFNFISQTDVNFATGANLYDVPTDIFITHNEFNHQDWDIQPRLTHGPFLGSIGLNKELTGTVQHFTSAGEYAFIGTLADAAGSVFLSTSVFLYNGDAYKVRFYPTDSNTLAYSLEGPKSNPPFDFLTRKVGDFYYLYINGDTGSYINLRDQESIGFTSCFYTSTVAGADLITDGCVTPTLQRQTVYYNDQSGVNMKINSTSNLEFDSLDGRIIHDGLLESHLDTLDRTLPGTFYFRLLGDGSTGLTSGLYYFGEMVAFGGYVDGNGYGTTQTVTNQDGNKLTRIFKSSWSSWVVV